MTISSMAGCENSSTIIPTDPVISTTNTIKPDDTPILKTHVYESVTNDELRDKVESRYGIEVYWNAEITDYPGTPPEPLQNEVLIRKFLILLDEQLALYPDGFFAHFRKFNYVFRFLPTLYVQHYVIGEEAGGYTQYSDDGYIYIVMNASYWTDIWPSTTTYSGCPYIQYALHHEIGHTLEWYIINRAKGFPFNTYVWRDLLPKGFEYYNNLELEERMEIPLLEFGAPYMDENQKGVWFCDYYAQSDISEHLASIFGYAMYPSQPDEWHSKNVQEQIKYYFPIIRQVFGTESWSETTHWEQAAQD